MAETDEDVTDEGEGQPSGLLDDEAANGPEGPPADVGSVESPPLDVAQVVKDAVAAAVAEANRVADKRINQVLSRIEKPEPPADEKPEPVEVQTADVRIARLTYREAVADKVSFLGDEEREFAFDMAGTLLAEACRAGDDEDRIGREVADQVAAKVKEMRSFYERRTLDALRRKGLLEGPPGQPPKGPPSTGQLSEFEKGAVLARERAGIAN